MSETLLYLPMTGRIVAHFRSPWGRIEVCRIVNVLCRKLAMNILNKIFTIDLGALLDGSYKI